MERLLQLFLDYLMVAVVSSITCVQLSGRNHCIHRGTHKWNWERSEAFCQSRRGHLVSIHDQKDIDAIKALGATEECKSFWTGGQCRSGNCTWTDGSSFDLEKFGEKEPSAPYQCIESSFEKAGEWSATDCDEKKCFVCETRDVMSDCADWYTANYRDDGVYSIIVNGNPYKVFCDMHTAGGGWVVFQRRVNGSDSFWDHNWTEYRNGFGKIGRNTTFWLGNEALHHLTNKDPDVILRVEMRGDRSPKAKHRTGYWWNNYFKFRVGSEETNYTLESLSINWRKIEGNASIGLFDMIDSVRAQFSTVDRINDPKPKCVTEYKMGGWWLRNCALATLNGAYELSKRSFEGYGLFWIKDMGYIIHPRKTTMMIRPDGKISNRTSTKYNQF
uniref:Fibrinogen C-terminal domain-containing protein n=1 Tax=Haemonchus contortus TaxID=6289 RepID=A0A7I4XYN6_HAECO